MKMMTTEEVDEFARELPSLTLHGALPVATTMALALRVTDLLEKVEKLEAMVKLCKELQEKARDYLVESGTCGNKGTVQELLGDFCYQDDCKYCDLDRAEVRLSKELER